MPFSQSIQILVSEFSNYSKSLFFHLCLSLEKSIGSLFQGMQVAGNFVDTTIRKFLYQCILTVT